MKKFSLVLNSKNRPQLLANLIDSIHKFTYDLDSIELLISCDEDDLETKEKLNWFYGNNLPNYINIEYIPRNRNLHERVNNLISRSTGQFIWFLNDDCLIEYTAAEWDISCYKLLQQYINQPILGHVGCTSVDKENGATYSSFPIVSREVYNRLGYIMPNSLPGLGGDVFLWRIFSQLNKIIKLPVSIRHILHESIEKIINCDITATEMREQTRLGGLDCWTIDISKELNILKNDI